MKNGITVQILKTLKEFKNVTLLGQTIKNTKLLKASQKKLFQI